MLQFGAEKECLDYASFSFGLCLIFVWIMLFGLCAVWIMMQTPLHRLLSRTYDRDFSISDSFGVIGEEVPPAISFAKGPHAGRGTKKCPDLTCPIRPPPYRIWTPKNAGDVYLKAGFRLEQFIRECQIGSPDDGTGSRDCEQYISEVFDPDYGKCFMLQLHKHKVAQTVAGRGVSLVLDLNYEHSNPRMHLDRRNNIIHSSECTIKQTDYDFSPKSGIHSCNPKNGMPSGAICRSELPHKDDWKLDFCKQNGSDDKADYDGALVKIGAPFDPAGKAELLICDAQQQHLTKMLSLDYTVGTCRLQCALFDVYRRCDCIRPFASQFLSTPYADLKQCSTKQMQQCAVNRTKLLQSAESIQRCTKNCLPPCEHFSFRALATSATLVPQHEPKKKDPQPEQIIYTVHRDQNYPFVPRRRKIKMEKPGLQALTGNQKLLTKRTKENETGLSENEIVLTENERKESDRASESSVPRHDPIQLGNPQKTSANQKLKSMTVPHGHEIAVGELKSRKSLSELGLSENEIVPKEKDIVCFLSGVCDSEGDRSHVDQIIDGNDENITCWIKYSEMPGERNVMCRTKREHYKKTVEKTLLELGIDSIDRYRQQFEWWKLVDKNKEPQQKDYKYRSDIIVLDIAYSEMQYVDIQQKHSMTVSTFIGNIGGQFGLWLGASIISIIKLVLICCERRAAPVVDCS